MNKNKKIILIAALNQFGIIGRAGGIPWPRLPDDIKNFKKLTVHNATISGRKTFQSIVDTLKNPLPNRENIVVTSSQINGAKVARSVKEAINLCTSKNIYLIGGEQIYCDGLEFATHAILTFVDYECCGDTFFPLKKFNLAGFKIEKFGVGAMSGVEEVTHHNFNNINYKIAYYAK